MPTKVPKPKERLKMTRMSQSGKEDQCNPPITRISTVKTKSDAQNFKRPNHRFKSTQNSLEPEDALSVSSVSISETNCRFKGGVGGGGVRSDLHGRDSSTGSSGISSVSPPIFASDTHLNHPKGYKQANGTLQKTKKFENGRIQKPNPKTQKSSVTSSSSDEKHCELDKPICKLYNIKTRLGKGAYGIVWEAYEKSLGTKVALKKIFDAFRNDTDAQRTYREIMFLREFGSHPNIIRLLNVHKAVNNMDIYLVFPFMEYDLHRLIKESPQLLTDDNIRTIFYQTLKAVKYLHSGEVIHRDLKPANILLDDFLNVKVGDFGLARSLSIVDDVVSETNPVMTDYVATRWYRPPEILLSCPVYTKGVDMWSLGCILAEMILKVPLFPGGSTVHQVETIMAHIDFPTAEEIQDICSHNIQSTMIESAMVNRKKSLEQIFEYNDPETIDIIKKFLVFNPARRLTAEGTLAHPYLARCRRISEELTMDHSVSPPLSDFVQLPMCQYRSVIYDLIQVRKVRDPQPQNFSLNNRRPVPKQARKKVQSQPVKEMKPEPFQNIKPVHDVHIGQVKLPDGYSANICTQFQISGFGSNKAPSNTDINLSISGSISNLSKHPSITSSGSKSLNEVIEERTRGTVGTRYWRSRSRAFDTPGCKLDAEIPANNLTENQKQSTHPEFISHEGDIHSHQNHNESFMFHKLAKQHNSTPNIGMQKPPGPDGDGCCFPFPYLIGLNSQGLVDKHPRYCNRTEHSVNSSNVYNPSDLRGADKKLFEIFSNRGDIEDEIKAMEQQLKTRRVASSNQPNWILDLTNNLNKVTVLDSVTTSNKNTRPAQLSQNMLNKSNPSGNSSFHNKLPQRNLSKTRLPDILQSWNPSHQNSRYEDKLSDHGTKETRHSTYFQDPPVSLHTNPTAVIKTSQNRQLSSGVNKAKPSRFKDDDSTHHRRVQSSQSNQGSCASGSPVSLSDISSPLERMHYRNRQYDSYSQTHGTISASDLNELKSSLRYFKSS